MCVLVASPCCLSTRALPAFSCAEGMWTHATYWKGEFADGMLPQLQALGNEDLLE